MTENADTFDLTQPNSHYMKNVENLTRTHEVIAHEDVLAAGGTKLIAKGTRLDHSLQERLLRFKLSQPLETSLAVNDGITPAKLLGAVDSLLDQIPILSKLVQSASVRNEVRSTIRSLQLGRISTMLASMGYDSQAGVYNHFALAVVTSLGIASRLGIDPGQLQHVAMVALLHDVGDLYINPEYQQRGRTLTPEEWKHIAAHPRIGQLVLENTTTLPRSISTAIAEHHERPNGFGYPGLRGAKDISVLGNIMLVTEVMCGVFSKDSHVFERASLAVKVIPGEYPKEIVSLFSTVLQQESADEPGGLSQTNTDDIIRRATRINAVLTDVLGQLGQLPVLAGNAGRLQDRIKERALMLRGAINATGISECLVTGSLSGEDMAGLALEIETVVFEIEWRIRELARQTTLAATALPAQQREIFSLAIDTLSAS